uniref:hypothetical protein n=1 Tax=Antribacter gilvus TaxID=2304675 RepID=UPI00197E9059
MPRRIAAATAAVLAALATSFVAPHVAEAAPVAPTAVVATTTSGGTSPDTVYYWNQVLLDLHAGSTAGPTVLARADAIVHAAIHDTINSAWWSYASQKETVIKGYRNYLGGSFFYASPSVNGDLATGMVARDLLKDLFPGQSATIDAAFTARHQPPLFIESEEALAADVVAAYRADRLNDGADASPVYTPDGVPGAWRPTDGCTVVA